MLVKIISGGQTGVDQAALQVALALGLQQGGWCPPGRISEEGKIPELFHLKETPRERSEYAPDIPRSQRTEWNVRDADATLILTPQIQAEDRGTAWTMKAAEMYHKPLLTLDPTLKESEKLLINWLAAHAIQTLNVAGPSERTEKGIGDKVYAFLRRTILSYYKKD